MAKSSNLLQNLRNDIDHLDRKIMELLQKRLSISRKIGLLKQKEKIAIKQNLREKKALDFRLWQAKNLKMNPTFIKKLFQLIFKESRHRQRSLTEKQK